MFVAPRTSSEFVEWLVARHPRLAVILEAHLSYHGEMLTHVLFGDVARYASDLARRAAVDPWADDELGKLLTDLDAAMSSEGDNDPVENLIWVSFVENAQGVSRDSEESLRIRLRSFPNLARGSVTTSDVSSVWPSVVTLEPSYEGLAGQDDAAGCNHDRDRPGRGRSDELSGR